MKKFKGLRKLDDVIEKAKELGYVYYQKNFQQRFKKGNLDICLGSFGKFHVYKAGECIASHMSEELDNETWYQEILEMLYAPVSKCDKNYQIKVGDAKCLE